MPELSLQLREEVTESESEERFQTAQSSKFEARLIKTLCEPLLRHIPARIHPNRISLVTHGVCWVTAIAAVSSSNLSKLGRSLALVIAGLGMFLSMLGDCLDGMHARNTNQCSKLGEMMDHWLDAIVVPLVPIGITMALEMEPWAIVLINVSTAMIYQAQLVLYHHTGKFIHPDAATGVEAQFGVSVAYIGLAVFFFFVDRQALWLDHTLAGIAVLGLIIQMRCNWFYYPKLGGLMRYHLLFVAYCAGFAFLYLRGVISVYPFLLALVFTSFRISGSYVLYTILGRRYDGADHGLPVALAAIASAHYFAADASLGPVALPALITYATCAYLALRNFIEFSRHYTALKPSAAQAP